MATAVAKKTCIKSYMLSLIASYTECYLILIRINLRQTILNLYKIISSMFVSKIYEVYQNEAKIGILSSGEVI